MDLAADDFKQQIDTDDVALVVIVLFVIFARKPATSATSFIINSLVGNI